jgi:hypothetical protein
MLSVRMTQGQVFFNRQTAVFARERTVYTRFGVHGHDHAAMIPVFTPAGSCFI